MFVFFFYFFDEPCGREISYSEATFEDIKHVDEDGNEFWYARELAKVLEYKDFRNFELVIFKAMEACKNSAKTVSDHIGDFTEMVSIGSGVQRPFPSYKLSRYACYLIVQNGDPRKEVIALGQTYFAVKTRQHELIEKYSDLTEKQKRLSIRQQMIEHNKSLVEAAKSAGVKTSVDYANFQNSGYRGLYGGLTAKDIKDRKGLSKNQAILDYMGSEELAANLFRATQTDAKLRRENIQGKTAANQTHFDVGQKVRNTIKELGGTMPEDLPTPEKGIGEIQKEVKKLEKE